VLDYFHSLPPAFVDRLKECLESHMEEVRHLRSENRQLRNICHGSVTSSPSKPTSTGTEDSRSPQEVAESTVCDAEPETNADFDTANPEQCPVSPEAVAAAGEEPEEVPEAVHEASPVPVYVWRPRTTVEAAPKSWPKASSFSPPAPPVGPPAVSSSAVDQLTQVYSPAVPQPAQNIALVARQVLTTAQQIVCVKPPASPTRSISPQHHRPGPPRRPARTGPTTPGRRANPAHLRTPQRTPNSSPPRRATMMTPDSRTRAACTPPQLPSWRAAPMVSAPRTLAFEGMQTPTQPPIDPTEYCKRRAKDERAMSNAEVSGAQALIAQLSDAIRAAHEKCRRQDAERWAIVNEAMRELAHGGPYLHREMRSPSSSRRSVQQRLVGSSCRSPTPGSEARRQLASPVSTRRRGFELDSGRSTPKSRLGAAPSVSPLRSRNGPNRRNNVGRSPH